jgi:hypothetical protein
VYFQNYIFNAFVIVNRDFRVKKLCAPGSVNDETLNLSLLPLVCTKSFRGKRYALESLITSHHIFLIYLFQKNL